MEEPVIYPLFSILNSDGSVTENYDSSKTPIAIQVAPASHFADGKARWMSLVNMSLTDPEHGTTDTGGTISTNPGTGIRWGYTSLLGTANNELPTLVCPEVNQPQSSLSENVVKYGYLPSDYFKQTGNGSPVEYPLDNNYAYCGASNIMSDSGWGTVPSAFNADGTLNPWARLHALAQEDGSQLTDLMIQNQTVNWSTGSINNNSIRGNYPAACVCRRFNPDGNTAGKWYLPSIAELAYVGYNLYKINQKLATIPTAVQVGDYESYGMLGGSLWSSSEYTENIAWVLDHQYSISYYSTKSRNYFNFRIRAFLAY